MDKCTRCADLIGKKGLCEALGIAVGSYGKYNDRGLIPSPDHMLDDRIPVWHANKIPAWLRAHPGIGSKSRAQEVDAA